MANQPEPHAPSDIATKHYVDAAITSLSGDVATSLTLTFGSPIFAGPINGLAIESSGAVMWVGSASGLNFCVLGASWDAGGNLTDGLVVVSASGGGATLYAYGSPLILNCPLNFQSLPTSDPHELGDAWNSAGTMKISAG